MTSIRGKIALVTGGNRGIGREACRQLAEKKAMVILTARDPEKGNEAAESLQADNLDVHFYELDVTQSETIESCISAVEKDFGRIDILVNNAGIYIDRDHQASDVPVETLAKTLDVNLYGPLRVSQAVLPLMKKNDFGRIVNVSSRMGQFAALSSGSLSYRISKTALNALTVIMADEVRDHNILINTMTPGWVRTDMGGKNANRSLEEGADTILYLAELDDDGPHGKFFGDRQELNW